MPTAKSEDSVLISEMVRINLPRFDSLENAVPPQMVIAW